jgi:hypothetical protein
VIGREFRTTSPAFNSREVKGLNAVKRSGRVALWAVTLTGLSLPLAFWEQRAESSPASSRIGLAKRGPKTFEP